MEQNIKNPTEAPATEQFCSHGLPHCSETWVKCSHQFHQKFQVFLWSQQQKLHLFSHVVWVWAKVNWQSGFSSFQWLFEPWKNECSWPLWMMQGWSHQEKCLQELTHFYCDHDYKMSQPDSAGWLTVEDGESLRDWACGCNITRELEVKMSQIWLIKQVPFGCSWSIMTSTDWLSSIVCPV